AAAAARQRPGAAPAVAYRRGRPGRSGARAAACTPGPGAADRQDRHVTARSRPPAASTIRAGPDRRAARPGRPHPPDLRADPRVDLWAARWPLAAGWPWHHHPATGHRAGYFTRPPARTDRTHCSSPMVYTCHSVPVSHRNPIVTTRTSKAFGLLAASPTSPATSAIAPSTVVILRAIWPGRGCGWVCRSAAANTAQIAPRTRPTALVAQALLISTRLDPNANDT